MACAVACNIFVSNVPRIASFHEREKVLTSMFFKFRSRLESKLRSRSHLKSKIPEPEPNKNNAALHPWVEQKENETYVGDFFSDRKILEFGAHQGLAIVFFCYESPLKHFLTFSKNMI